MISMNGLLECDTIYSIYCVIVSLVIVKSLYFLLYLQCCGDISDQMMELICGNNHLAKVI